MKSTPIVFLITSLLTLTVLSGCKKEPCEVLICYNGASCADGQCQCLPGYEGDFCESEIRTRYVDTYIVDEVCGGDDATYECDVMMSADAVERIIFSNFSNIESQGIIPNVYGILNAEGFTIPEQTVEGNTFSGSGILLSNNQLALTYTWTNTQGSLTCSATYDPQ